jgi:hypothetical protein
MDEIKEAISVSWLAIANLSVIEERLAEEVREHKGALKHLSGCRGFLEGMKIRTESFTVCYPKILILGEKILSYPMNKPKTN